MPANLENSAVATGLEKVSFHSSPKERQCQRMFEPLHNCTHLTCLAKSCSTFSKLGFSSTWIENFQMFKLDLEKVESQVADICWIIEKQHKIHKIIYFCFIDYTNAFDCVEHKKTWKILKEMGLSDHITCLLRNLYAGQETTDRTGHGTIDWFQIRKRVHQGCILSPCLFKLYAEYIMWNARWSIR